MMQSFCPLFNPTLTSGLQISSSKEGFPRDRQKETLKKNGVTNQSPSEITAVVQRVLWVAVVNMWGPTVIRSTF